MSLNIDGIRLFPTDDGWLLLRKILNKNNVFGFSSFFNDRFQKCINKELNSFDFSGYEYANIYLKNFIKKSEFAREDAIVIKSKMQKYLLDNNITLEEFIRNSELLAYNDGD